MKQANLISHLKQILDASLGEAEAAACLAEVLNAAMPDSIIDVAAVQDIAGESFSAVLEAAWAWRLLVPLRSSGCGEWDYLVFSLNPDDRFRMPNLSRYLLANAGKAGRLDVEQTLLDLFKDMGEPDWEKMPEICACLVNTAVHETVTGAQIKAACVQSGLGRKAGAVIAVLKAGEVISPRLSDKVAAGASRSPYYDLHPCLRFLKGE